MNLKPMIILTCLFGMVVSNVHADTYNFYFTKPKKKAGTQSEETQNPEQPQENAEGQSEKPEQADPVNGQSKGVITNAGQTPIIVNNYNNNNNNVTAPAGSSPAASSTEVIPVTRIPRFTPFRFGLSGLYFSKMEYHEGSFDTEFFNPGRAPKYTQTAGGLFSFAYTPSTIFAVNVFLAGHYSQKVRKSFYMFGMDAEFYPFATASPKELGIFELGLLVGANSHLFSDHHELLSLHAGARFTINFSDKVGLTTVGRIAVDQAFVESGLVVRL